MANTAGPEFSTSPGFWVLDEPLKCDIWGEKRATFSHLRKIQTLSVRKLYTHQPRLYCIKAAGIIIVLASHFPLMVDRIHLGSVTLCVCECAVSLIQQLTLNKEKKWVKKHPPLSNKRQCKGFELQLTNVVLFFAGNRVAANLSVLNGSKIPLKGKSTNDNKLWTTCSLNQIHTSPITQKMWACHFFYFIFFKKEP